MEIRRKKREIIFVLLNFPVFFFEDINTGKQESYIKK